MPDIDDIHDAIVTIARLKVAVCRRQTRYVDQYNGLQSIIGGISRRYGFSPDSVTQAITGQVHSGDRSILVAGWVYRERIKLANSRRRLKLTTVPKEWLILYSMDQLGSWTNRLNREDVSQQRIGNRILNVELSRFREGFQGSRQLPLTEG